MEKKLTDEEIVKDIERSTGMPSYWKKIVLDLIHRLQSENERLSLIASILDKGVAVEIVNMQETIDKQKAEIERLTSLYDGLSGFMTSSIGDLPLTVEGLRKAVDEISRLLIVQTELQELNAKYYNEAKDLRRENAELQKQVQELIEMGDYGTGYEDGKEEGYQLGKKFAVQKAEEPSVKNTAKAILQELWDETEPLNESHKWVRLRIKNIASRKGVEVE